MLVRIVVLYDIVVLFVGFDCLGGCVCFVDCWAIMLFLKLVWFDFAVIVVYYCVAVVGLLVSIV